MKFSNRRTVTLNIELTIGLFKIVYVVRDSNVLHSGGGCFRPVNIYIEISGADRGARKTQTIYVRRTYFINAFLYELCLFYLITKQL